MTSFAANAVVLLWSGLASFAFAWSGTARSGPPWQGLRLGMLRVTAYGLCAAAGMVAGMMLARRLARQQAMDRTDSPLSRRSLGPLKSFDSPIAFSPPDPEAVWDAGLVAILSCFAASRLLLILRDPITFGHYPLLVLALPSLTYGGLAVAAMLVWLYLRRKHLALLPMLDIFAAPAAVFAAGLEIGHWLEGSEAGMPTTLPWGAHEPWVSNLPVHPVALYGAVAALVLAGALWFAARPRKRVRRGASLSVPGRVAAGAMIAGGGLAFGLSFCTQPLPYQVTLWLEPGQWIALGAMLGGALLWTLLPQTPPPSAADLGAPALTQQLPAALAPAQRSPAAPIALQHAEVR